MDPCTHPMLEKLDDKQFSGFASFKAGARFYRCTSPECGQVLKTQPNGIIVDVPTSSPKTE